MTCRKDRFAFSFFREWQQKSRYFICGALALTQFIWAEFALSGDTGPWVPIDFENGISFNHPHDRYNVILRFRVQNLLHYESELGNQGAKITGQPRRFRMRLGGWAVDERFRFNLQLSFTRGDMDWGNTNFPNIVRDATVMYRLLPKFEIAFGQTKLPGNRERVVSSGDLQVVDRSIVNRAFNLDRDFGIQARLRQGQKDGFGWALLTALSTGGGRNSPTGNADSFALTMRAEGLPFGEFRNDGDYFEGDLLGEQNPKISVGVFASQFRRISRSGGTTLYSLTPSSNGRGFLTLGGDLTGKYRGLSIYLEYVQKRLIEWQPIVQDFQETPTSFSSPLDGTGFNAQVGYLMDNSWEPVCRYSVVTPRTVAIEAFAYQQRQYTLGLNRYIQNHRIKVQADVSKNLFQIPNGSSGTIGQWSGRFQVELGI